MICIQCCKNKELFNYFFSTDINKWRKLATSYQNKRKRPYLLQFLTTLLYFTSEGKHLSTVTSSTAKHIFEVSDPQTIVCIKHLIRIFCQDHKLLLRIMIFIQLSLFVSFTVGKLKLSLCELAQSTETKSGTSSIHSYAEIKPGSSF